jgi:hypothetical protein
MKLFLISWLLGVPSWVIGVGLGCLRRFEPKCRWEDYY